jgi:DNA-3-methyladenine glycosylase
MESKNILNNDCIHVNNLINNESKLDREFYSTNAVQLARNLLGKIIVRKLGNVTVKCRIVETEAYMGPFDKGAHSYNNKKTERTKYFWQTGGCLYVYSIHQSVFMNIVANDKDKPEAVLIRAVEPLSGIEKIKENRKDLKSSKRPKGFDQFDKWTRQSMCCLKHNQII